MNFGVGVLKRLSYFGYVRYKPRLAWLGLIISLGIDLSSSLQFEWKIKFATANQFYRSWTKYLLSYSRRGPLFLRIPEARRIPELSFSARYLESPSRQAAIDGRRGGQPPLGFPRSPLHTRRQGDLA